MNGSSFLIFDNAKIYNKLSLSMKWPGYQQSIKNAKTVQSRKEYRLYSYSSYPNFFHEIKSLFHTHVYDITHCLWYQSPQNTKLIGCGAGILYVSPSFTCSYFANGFQKIITLIKTPFILLSQYWFQLHLPNLYSACSVACLLLPLTFLG